MTRLPRRKARRRSASVEGEAVGVVPMSGSIEATTADSQASGTINSVR